MASRNRVSNFVQHWILFDTRCVATNQKVLNKDPWIKSTFLCFSSATIRSLILTNVESKNWIHSWFLFKVFVRGDSDCEARNGGLLQNSAKKNSLINYLVQVVKKTGRVYCFVVEITLRADPSYEQLNNWLRWLHWLHLWLFSFKLLFCCSCTKRIGSCVSLWFDRFVQNKYEAVSSSLVRATLRTQKCSKRVTSMCVTAPQFCWLPVRDLQDALGEKARFWVRWGVNFKWFVAYVSWPRQI